MAFQNPNVLPLFKELNRRLTSVESAQDIDALEAKLMAGLMLRMEQTLVSKLESSLARKMEPTLFDRVERKVDDVLDKRLDALINKKMDVYVSKVIEHDQKIAEMKKNIVTVSTMKMEAYVEDKVKALENRIGFGMTAPTPSSSPALPEAMATTEAATAEADTTEAATTEAATTEAATTEAATVEAATVEAATVEAATVEAAAAAPKKKRVGAAYKKSSTAIDIQDR
jgi:cobalamin biosynthesis Mg chelatase CobN